MRHYRMMPMLFSLAIVLVIVAGCAGTITQPTTSTVLTPTSFSALTLTPTLTSSTTLVSTPNTTTTLSSAPSTPTLKSPLNGSSTSSLTPTLEWQPSSGDASYGLQVATDQDFGNLVIDERGLKEASYLMPSSKLGYSKTLYWRVGVGNAAGTSEWSPSWTFMVPSSSAPKPTPTLSGATLENILGIHTTQAIGEQKTIVIIAEFPDVKPTLSKEQIYNKVFVDFDNYLRNSSYGQIWLKGNVTTSYKLSQPASSYNISQYTSMIETERPLFRSLVQSVIDAADGDVNFSQYSRVIIILGASAKTLLWGCMIPGVVGTPTISTKSGQIIRSAIMFCEDNVLGNFAHDSMHMLGGSFPGGRILPCLYDQDLQSTPGNFRGFCQFHLIHMGFWDPLSCHFYQPATPPMGLSSWTKLRLGWIEPSKIAIATPGQMGTFTLDPLESVTSSTLVIKILLTSNTFYLIENRQKVGFDQYTPSSGVLISYADDGYTGECQHGQGPVQLMDANPDVPYLQGAAFNIGKKEIFVDTQNNLAVVLLQKVGLSYDIKITTADKVDTASASCVFPAFPTGFQRTK